MIYSGLPTGRLNTELSSELDHPLDQVDDLTRAVLDDTPELQQLPDAIKLMFTQAVQKAVVLGIEAKDEKEVDKEEQAELAEAIAEVTLSNLGISATSPYVTRHDVRRAAFEAALDALQPEPTESEIASAM